MGKGHRLTTVSRAKAPLAALLLSGISVLALAGPALADDFTVDTATTVTNGGFLINGNDTLTIAPSGSIVPPVGSNGVFSTGGNNEVDNQGLIEATGNNVFGIINNTSSNSPITNSGTVHTVGNGTQGIRNDNSNYSPITNSGTVYTEGVAAIGIHNNNSLHSPLINTGTIRTEGVQATGIRNAFSVDSPITNSGSVYTTGADAIGIFNAASSDSPVINSGYVVSAQGDSFRFLSTTNSPLTLKAPSYIGGAINFMSTTTLDIQTGPSHSVLWQLPADMTGGAPNISGSVPWFYNSGTMQFATYDPSVFAGSLDLLGDLTRLLSRVGRTGLDGRRLADSNMHGTSGFWLAGFGGAIWHDGDGAMTLERNIDQYGFAIGYRGAGIGGFEWGVMGGYVDNRMDIASRWTTSYDVSGQGWFAGLNTRGQLGALKVDAGVTGGRLGYDQSRFVNDNLALTNGQTLGRSWADASYDGWYVAPELGIGLDLGTWGGWTLTPSARIRYAAQWLGGYDETGSNANASVDARRLGLAEASSELALSRQLDYGALTLRVGYLGRASTGNDKVAVSLLGIGQDVPFGDTDTHTGYAGVAFDVDIAANTKLSLDFTGYAAGTMSGGKAIARLRAAF